MGKRTGRPRGRPKGSRDVAGRLRWCVDEALNMLETRSGKEVAEHISEDMEKYGIGPVVKQFQGFFPKEIDMDVSTRSIEDFVTGAVVEQQNDSSEETNIH